MERIILASASGRRKILLEQLIGKNFDVCVSSYSEDEVHGIGPIELVMHHALEKAKNVASKYKNGVIISADTVILCKGEVLGKPANSKHAKEMLKKISGQEIQAITGLTVMEARVTKKVCAYEVTHLWIREMTEGMIEDYVSTEEPFGKAGSFAIQGKGAILVERIEGDFFNVVGLPLFRLSGMLEEFDIDILNPCNL